MISLKRIKSLTNFYWLKIQKFRQTGYLKYLYRNKLDKAGFAHDAAYSDSKDLAKRTVLDNILKESLWNRGYDGYQRALASMFHKFFEKKIGSRAIATSEAGVSLNEQLAEEYVHQ